MDGYFLDVATDSLFTDFVIENKDEGNYRTDIITGLDPATDYYFRVRCYTDIQMSEYSNVIKVTTLAS